MLRRTLYSALPVLVLAALTTVSPGSAAGNESPPGSHAGPPYKFTTEIMHGNVIPLKNQAMITKTEHGYRFRAGQQDSHLVVTLVSGGIRFVDTGTQSFRRLSPSCQRLKVNPGVAAICRVPASISTRRPLLLEIWPRLGDDFVDTSALPVMFSATVLGDKGRDVAHFGPGRDFFNGYTGRDRVWGGGGNDWIRSGLGDDVVRSGAGDDDVVAVEGSDAVSGGLGDDRLWAGDGNDRLSGGDGADFFVCGTGRDDVKVGTGDTIVSDCESVDRVG